MNILLTGATGFIGSSVLANLGEHNVVTLGRTWASLSRYHFKIEMDENSDYSDCLTDIHCIIHCAARVHVMRDTVENPMEEFRRTNVDATLNLAKQAAQAGVKRFIFISSIKVNGESTTNQKPFNPNDKPNPQDAYGQSKYEAEIALRQLADETGLEVVVIRSPMVYGPGVKGNMRSLMNIAAKGIPLPLGGIANARSLVGVDNLVSLIKTVIDHPCAANQIFLVSDGQDLSTSDILKLFLKAKNKHTWLIPTPIGLVSALLQFVGKAAIADRLYGSLQVDISKTQSLLGWDPLVSVEEGFKRMCDDIQTQ